MRWVALLLSSVFLGSSLPAGEIPSAPATALAPVLTPAPAAAPAGGVSAKSIISFYGYIKLDAAWDESVVAPVGQNNSAQWVVNTPVTHLFAITARETRIGMNFEPPVIGSGPKITGKFECDFYGGGNEDAAVVRTRLAYVDAAWFDGRLSLRAGQDRDTFAPLTMATENINTGNYQGTLGSRIPQFRVTTLFNVGTVQGTLAVAAVRPYAKVDLDNDKLDDGMASGLPDGEARLGFSGNNGYFAWAIGFGGVMGVEVLTIPSFVDYTVKGLAIDYKFDCTKKVSLSGEAWWGENIDSYDGGIGQGINTTLGVPIRAHGGFAQLILSPTSKVTIKGGAGFDMCSASDLNAGDRRLNYTWFANAGYMFGEKTTVTAEFQRIITQYIAAPTADDNRVQLSIKYVF
jgi:hypothetical protein